MSLVKWEKDETVAVLTMTNGENRHNPDWTNAMLNAFDEIMADQEIKAIVIAADDPKAWNLGVDLTWMMEKQKDKDVQAISDWLIKNNEVFKFCLMSPVPTIAAITGHAFGNGAMLACACDFRFMRGDRGYFCFPEVDLGILFTPSMNEWVKKCIPYHQFLMMKWTGKKVTAADLEATGAIVKACDDQEATLKDAIAFGKTFNKNRATLEEMKKRTYKHILDKIENEDPEYLKPPVFMFKA